MLIIVENSEEEQYRTLRILEEAEKMGCKVDLINSSGMKFLTNKVFVKGKELYFEEYDAIYSIGNSDRHHYFIMLATIKTGVRIWPSNKHLLMNDKFFEGIFLDNLGIRTPKTILLTSKEKVVVDKLVEEIGGYPCVAKKVTGSEGRYVCLVESFDDLYKFLEKLPHPSISGKKGILLQEYIEESKGTDFRTYCVGDEILGAIQRTSQTDDFRANVSLGGVAEKIEVTAEMEEFSRKIMKEGNFLFAGIDFIMSNSGLVAIEINTSADFKGFEKATGINVAEKIIKKFLE